jgi:hypothetical protein
MKTYRFVGLSKKVSWASLNQATKDVQGAIVALEILTIS